ncbi:ABC transporter ATP-binding protein [Thermosulfurimonas marina]|uniref:ABC transporter ATP-binding protein n=1 Tax=Thermosulfurimonas marina TaxID=2047767 RepID=A0A6H1WTL9_9BACT|nr:ABC transporter ATP-binding protein [Thermosulfurimonas marina]QJA06466.1 ABC transporter ATP-binding protein [Thermosulfurimonas marina]
MEGVPLLQVKGLRLGLRSGPVLVDGVDFGLGRGEILGLVGESGCGKSLTGLSCLGLFPPGVIPLEGRVLFQNQDLLSLAPEERRRFRGRHLALIFQEPLSALNPVFTIGHQIEEVLSEHRGLRGEAAREEALRLLAEVRLPDPEVRYGNYPHELSGGMRQRAMIAMALAGEPEVLVADEPTTALDVTVQAQILELFRELRLRRHLALLFISHDLSVIREVADRVAVMYAGEIVEEAPREALFEQPLHPYTRGLLAAFPRLGVRRLEALPGQVPSPGRWPSGCRFAPRCPEREGRCERIHPELREVSPGRKVRCLRR